MFYNTYTLWKKYIVTGIVIAVINYFINDEGAWNKKEKEMGKLGKDRDF